MSAEASNAMGKHCSSQSGRAVLLEAEGLGLPFVDLPSNVCFSLPGVSTGGDPMQYPYWKANLYSI